MQPAEGAVYRELLRRAVPRGTVATPPQILIAALKELVLRKHLTLLCPRCGEDIAVPSCETRCVHRAPPQPAVPAARLPATVTRP